MPQETHHKIVIRQFSQTDDLSLPYSRLSTAGIPEGPARQTADTFLGFGEKVFDVASGLSYTSGFFERETSGRRPPPGPPPPATL